jgi:hypothetical protein
MNASAAQSAGRHRRDSKRPLGKTSDRTSDRPVGIAYSQELTHAAVTPDGSEPGDLMSA